MPHKDFIKAHVHQNKDATSEIILQHCVALSKMVQVVRCANADRQITARRHSKSQFQNKTTIPNNIVFLIWDFDYIDSSAKNEAQFD